MFLNVIQSESEFAKVAYFSLLVFFFFITLSLKYQIKDLNRTHFKPPP